MAFNKRILDKLDDAVGENEFMRDYFHDIISFELLEKSQYMDKYQKFLKKHAKEELEEKVGR